MRTGNLGDFSGVPIEQPAIIDLSGDRVRTLDYGGYLARIDGVARLLQNIGLERGTRIGLIGRNRLEYLIAYFAIMKVGLVAVPINHRFPLAMVEFIICDSDVRLVFGESDFLEAVPAGVARHSFEEIADITADVPLPAVEPEPDETAMILYTSGSTGRPKGVPLSHAGQRWVIDVRSSMADYGAHRLLIAAPLCHMNGLLMSQMAAFNGAQIVLLPEFSAPAYIEAINKYRCTWITSVPTMLAMVAREREKLASADLSSVKIAAMASAPVSMALFSDVAKIFPSAMVVTNYGSTEAGAGIFGQHPEGMPRPPLSVGCPLPQIGFRLIDATGKEAGEGILQLKTPAMTKGYINHPDATAKLFTPDGWLNTGDVIRQDKNGFCFFVRRADDMFVCGGENIFPAAVEGVLESHPAVEQACVVPVPDELKGTKPVAYVVLRASQSVTENELKQHFLAHAPAYMHPRRIFLVERLPLSPTNKIDRSVLQKRALEQML